MVYDLHVSVPNWDFISLLITDLFKACYPWSVLDLHVAEIHVLPVSNFYIIIDYL